MITTSNNYERGLRVIEVRCLALETAITVDVLSFALLMIKILN